MTERGRMVMKKSIGCLIISLFVFAPGILNAESLYQRDLTGRELPGAGTAVIPDEKAYVLSLNGTWRFKLEQSKGFDKEKGIIGNQPIAVDYPENFEAFYSPAYQEGKEWVDLPVPGNWEMAGLSPLTYNQPDNSSGFYRLWFDVPKSWKGRSVRVQFDGIQNGAEIWLNGEPVPVSGPSWGKMNYHESGWTAFQADLSQAVKVGKKNLLAIRVTKNTRSSDEDSGDYFFLGGIYRPVMLFSVPQSHMTDFTVQTRLLEDKRAELKVIVKTTGTDASAVFMQLEGSARPLKAKIGSDQAILTQIVQNPRLWSAEFPHLYSLSLSLADTKGKIRERVSTQIGIREVTVKDGVLLLNGVPVKFAGICRQDLSPDEGCAVGMDLWEKDIRLMKAANINAIRTSHYPYGAGFYELCDRLGMYVVDELPYCWSPNDSIELLPSYLLRARETVWRDKNHPCVLVWAIGNEGKGGRNFQAVADLVKELDATRPSAVTRFDGDKYHTLLSDSHYSSPRTIENRARESEKTGHPHIFLENPNTWDIRLGADPGAWEAWGPVLQRVWDVCVKYPTIPGTFLWEWQDRAIIDRNQTRYYFYDTETGLSYKKVKGLVDAFRNPRPWYYDVKMIYSPVRIKELVSVEEDRLSLELENRYSFTDLSHLEMVWTLEQKGKPLRSATVRAHVPPMEAGTVTVKFGPGGLDRSDAVRIEFIHPDGNQVVSHRFNLKPLVVQSQIDLTENREVPVPDFNLVTRETKKDRQIWRSIVRSEAMLVNVVKEPASATTLAEFRRLQAEVALGPEKKIVGKLTAEYIDGEFSYRLEWTGSKEEVQEIGWAFRMPASCTDFSWNRNARWTDYPDNHTSRAEGTARPGPLNATIMKMDRTDAFDFNSTKYNCNWASLTTKEGRGIRAEFSAGEPYHCRAGGSGQEGYTLFVNRQVSPPRDISSSVVEDLYLDLKAGDVIEGRFHLGAN